MLFLGSIFSLPSSWKQKAKNVALIKITAGKQNKEYDKDSCAFIRNKT